MGGDTRNIIKTLILSPLYFSLTIRERLALVRRMSIECQEILTEKPSYDSMDLPEKHV